jgi:hypothetical protein
MLDDVACDTDVRLVNIFHLVDETDLAGWQSGLFFADETPKLSAATVASWLASTDATCGGRATAWRPGATLALPVLDLSKLKLPTAPFLPPVLAAPSSLEAPAATEQSPLSPAQVAAPDTSAAADPASAPPPSDDTTAASDQPQPTG